MTTQTADSERIEAPLTEGAPDPGCAVSFGILVSEGEHWVEEGVHVIRSTEFDVIAGDPDFDRALDQFVDKHEDLWGYLSGLEELTDNENETFLKLAPRFLAIHRELERREEERRKRRISVSFGAFRRRHRGNTLHGWQQGSSTPARSSQPSAV